MAERPILFSGPMVRAILEGRKTQTRRIMDPQPTPEPKNDIGQTPYKALIWDSPCGSVRFHSATTAAGVFSPYGDKGSRLWVREEHWAWGRWVLDGETATGRRKYRFVAVSPPAGVDAVKFERKLTDSPTVKRNGDVGWVYRHARFMPRAASRIDLEIVSVRVERLQDITEADIIAEGVTVPLASQMTGIPWSDLPTLHHAWAAGWNHINGDRATWESNPWVWVVEFKRVHP